MPLRTLILSALAAVLATAPLASQEPQADLRPGVAVMPFSFGGAIGGRAQEMADLGVGVQQMLITEFAQNSALRIIERTALQQILQEQDLVTAGRVDAQTAARIGKMIGARYMILGSYSEVAGRMRIDGRIVDVETSEVLQAQSVQNRRQRFYPMIVELSSKLTRSAQLPPLPARAERQRMGRNIPPEAAALYSRALVLQDLGQTDRAVELYQRIVSDFPQMTEARDALRQLREPAQTS